MQNEVLDTFLALTGIDSESYHEAGIAEYVMDAARKCGYRPYMDNAGKTIGGDAGNVYVNIPASGVDAPPLLFCAHLDTVAPGKGVRAVLKGGKFVSEGETVLGADCKAGVAALIELMRRIAEGAVACGPLELLFTVAEEVQLKGSRNLERERLKARHAVVLDGSGSVGDLINASPTQDNLEFAFIGKAAHAGVEPEKGVNAIMGAAWAVSLMRLGRIDSETTANIGLIRGGRAVNIVPDLAVVEGEIRSHDPAKLEEQRRSMVKAAMEAEAAVGVVVQNKVERAYDGFRIDPGDPLVVLCCEAARSMGMKMEIKPSGGGSDANLLNAYGIKAVVLSMGAKESHTTREYLEARDLQGLVSLCAEIAASAGRLGEEQ